MKKKYIRSDFLEEGYYNYSFKNGFNVYFYPKESVVKTAYLLIKYGSIDTKFIDSLGKEISHPDGSAHFLEHKLFENEKLSVIKEMANLGANVNAFTSHDITSYYFTTIDNFNKALNILVSLPVDLQYTHEGIESEKLIISREIDMYLDDEDYRLYRTIISKLYKFNPVGRDIAGGKDDIIKIDKSTLDQIIENFYTPDNMSLYISGDLNESDINEIISNLPSFYMTNKKRAITLKSKKEVHYNIDDTVIDTTNNISAFCLGIRLDEKIKNNYLVEIKYNLFLNYLFGTSSEFYETNYKKDYFNNLSYKYIFGDNYRFVIIEGESKFPLKIKEEIIVAIRNFDENGINENIINRIKKKILGRYLMSFETVKGTTSNFIRFYKRENSIYNYLDDVKNMEISNMNEIKNGVYAFGYSIKRRNDESGSF